MKLGELFVDLGFDVDDQKLDAFNRKIEKSAEGIGKLAAGAVAGVGALGLFVQNAAEGAIKLQNMRADFGANTQAAQTFANALHQVNAAISVDEGLDKYRKLSEIVKASISQGAGGAATGALARLGVEWHEGIGVEEVRQQIGRNKDKTMAGLSSDPATAKAIYASLLDAIGLGGTTKLFDVKEEEFQKAALYNKTEDQIEQLGRFGTATAKLSESFTKFSNDLASELSALSPAVDRLTHTLDGITGYNAKHPGAVVGEAALGGGLVASMGRLLGGLPVVGGLAKFGGAMGILSAMGSIPWVASDAGTALVENTEWGQNKKKEIAEGRGKGTFNAWMAIKNNPNWKWNVGQTQGLIMRLQDESGLDPDIYGHGKEAKGMPGEAYGIAQWHKDRQAEFKKLFKKDIHGSTLAEQLEFVNYELTRGNEKRAGSLLEGANSVGSAYKVAKNDYERPAGSKPTVVNNTTINVHSTGRPREVAEEITGMLDKRTNAAFAQTNLGASQ